MLRKVVAIMTFGLAALSAAGPQTYASRVQNIRAGIVVLEADRLAPGSFPRSAAPHVWYNLDANSRLKPAGWNFYNPLAPSIATDDIVARWTAINGSIGLGAPSPASGDRITKAQGAYWEVFLSRAAESQLAQYDVLLISPRRNFSISANEREKLRKFVDQGGTLWVDFGGLPATADTVNSLPVAVELEANPSTTLLTDYQQPLLSFPNVLTARDVTLANGQPGATNNWVTRPATSGLSGFFLSLESEFENLQPVSVVGAPGDNRFVISQAQIGEGHLVITSRGVAQKLGMTITDTGIDGNASYTAKEPVLSNAGVSAARFAINLVNLGASFRQTAGGTRRTNSTFVNLQAPLLKRFDYPGALNPAAPPVIYKGVLLVSSNNRLYAFDATPGGDLDRDGNPDDGLPDLGLGTSEDLLWVSQTLNGPISGPAAAEIAQPLGGRPNDQVLVTDANGVVHAFSVFNFNANGSIVGNANLPRLYALVPPNGNAGWNGKQPLAPTVHEGLAYMTDTYGGPSARRGRMWIGNLKTESVVTTSQAFALGGGSSQANLPEFSANATIGYIPIADNSGGFDRVLYAPFWPQATVTPNPSSVAGFASLWLGAKGEAHALPSTAVPTTNTAQIDSGALVITTRVAGQGLPIWIPAPAGPEGAFGPRIYLQDANGFPLNEAALSSRFTGNVTQSDGVLRFELQVGVTEANFNGLTARVDYSIDIGAVTNTPSANNVVRGTVNFPDASGSRVVIGNLALSPAGTIHAVVGSATEGGYFAIKEEGRGVFNLRARYELYSRHNIVLNDAGRVTYDEVLYDKDPVNAFIPSPTEADARLRGFSFRSGPVVRNGQVFVAAQAGKSINAPGFGVVPIPVGILLAFRAEPLAPEVPVGNVGEQITLLQKDFAKSADDTQPEQDSVLQPGNLQSGNFEYDAARGILTLRSLSSTNRGPMTNSLSLSQPVILRTGTSGDRLIEPDAGGSGRWSPLLWYATVPGMTLPAIQPQSTALPSVFVGGNTVYMAGSNVTPNLLSGNGLAPVGTIQAWDADISGNDPTITAANSPSTPITNVRPWNKQLWSIVPDGVGIRGNDHIRWPQFAGITGLEDLVVRLNQTILPGSTQSFGLVGGNGTLVAWGNGGITAYNRSDFVIADQGRIGIFDANGNPSFTTDATAFFGPNGESGSASIRPLVRPTKTYAQPNGEVLIVDSGANRIVRTDSSGREIRSLDSFILDPAILPEGYNANAPRTFSNPRDVQTWTSTQVLGGTPIVSNQQPLEQWVHYLVADSGNRRLVEVVDRYQLNAQRQIVDVVRVGGVPQLGVLAWHSPASVSGADFEYLSVNRLFIAGAVPADNRYVYVAGIGSAVPTNTGVGLDSGNAAPGTLVESRGGNGGVVIFDPRLSNLVRVVNRLELPDWTQSVVWDETRFPTLKRFRSAVDTTDGAILPAQVASRRQQTRLLSGVTSVTGSVRRNGSGLTQLWIMVADANGVYEFIYDPAGFTGPAGDTAPVKWFLPKEAWLGIKTGVNTALNFNGPNDANGADVITGPTSRNAMGFRPMYARRLDSGEILIVNGYLGQRRAFGPNRVGDPFYGEIVQLDGVDNVSVSGTTLAVNPSLFNLGFRLASIRFELGPITGTRGLIQPIFADRR